MTSFAIIIYCLKVLFLVLSRWYRLIQRPYENGDYRGLKLVKAILKPLMLRRTKETKDKEGRYLSYSLV